MNTNQQPNIDQQPQTRRRFCDSIGITGLACLAFFAAFVALIEHAGKF